MAKKSAPKRAARKKKPSSTVARGRPSAASNYPRHSAEAALRIPRAILDQNAGKASTDGQAAEFLGLKSSKGPFAVEISSGIKYGFLNRPSTGKLEVSQLARQIRRPKAPEDVTKGYQQAAIFKALSEEVT
jgi:hypothetical protein